MIPSANFRVTFSELTKRLDQLDLTRHACFGSGQFSHAAMPRPMIHSLSLSERNFSSSVNKVKHCLYGQGRCERSVPQKQRCGPKASTTRWMSGWRVGKGYGSST